MIAFLAICRKVIILDFSDTDAPHIQTLAASILALGVVYWLIGDRVRIPVKRPKHTDRQVHRLLTKTGSFSSAARLNTMLSEGLSSLRAWKGIAMSWPVSQVRSPTPSTT
jgi:hypothetical protein